MLTLISSIFSSLITVERAHSGHHNGIPQELLEAAEARVGFNPYEAETLRQAASAYLSVVR